VNAFQESPNLDQVASRMAAMEKQAFCDFATAFGPRLRGLFLYHGLSLSDAEELAVSCVSDIALKIDRFRPQGDGSFERWAFTVARHALAKWHQARRKQGEQSPLPDDLSDSYDARENEAVCSVVEAVHNAIDELPEIERTLIALYDLEGSGKLRDLAELVGLKPNTARVRRHRALKSLEKKLGDNPAIRSWLARQRPKSGG